MSASNIYIHREVPGSRWRPRHPIYIQWPSNMRLLRSLLLPRFTARSTNSVEIFRGEEEQALGPACQREEVRVCAHILEPAADHRVPQVSNSVFSPTGAHGQCWLVGPAWKPPQESSRARGMWAGAAGFRWAEGKRNWATRWRGGKG